HVVDQRQDGNDPATPPQHHARWIAICVLRPGVHRRLSRSGIIPTLAARRSRRPDMRHGHIVAEFFDIGYTRELPWAKRPQAAALLPTLADPQRGFDAIVVGEYARAFSGTQLRHLAPLLQQHRVQLWLPETHGPVDAQDPTHQALLLMLGAQAKREV